MHGKCLAVCYLADVIKLLLIRLLVILQLGKEVVL